MYVTWIVIDRLVDPRDRSSLNRIGTVRVSKKRDCKTSDLASRHTTRRHRKKGLRKEGTKEILHPVYPRFRENIGAATPFQVSGSPYWSKRSEIGASAIPKHTRITRTLHEAPKIFATPHRPNQVFAHYKPRKEQRGDDKRKNENEKKRTSESVRAISRRSSHIPSCRHCPRPPLLLLGFPTPLLFWFLPPGWLAPPTPKSPDLHWLPVFLISRGKEKTSIYFLSSFASLSELSF